MVADQEPTGTRRVVLIVLAAVLAVAVGVAAGVIIIRGGIGASPTTTIASVTTTPQPPTTTPAPTTTMPATTTSQPTLANEIVVPVAEDTEVDSEAGDEVLGQLPSLEADQDDTDPNDTERILLRFQVEGLPDDQPIGYARLRIFQVDRTERGGSVSRVDGPWTEAETTWATAPPVGEPIAALPVNADNGYIDIDVTPAVTGNGVVDLYLTTPFNQSVEFASKESGQGASLVIGWGDVVAQTDSLLVGAGDIASCGSEGDEATAALIAEVATDSENLVVFTLGDNAYESGSLPEFNDCFHPSWGQFKDVTRPAAGAREYRTEGAAGYFAYFGSAAGEVGEGYYSYDAGDWHIVVLNSNCADVGGCESGSAQEQWLRQDLEAFSNFCTLAYWHHPLFSSGGGEAAVEDLYQALYDAGAEVVINADSHFYERFEPQGPDGNLDEAGIRQFIVGTGGRSLENIGASAPNSVVSSNDGFGVLALTLSPGGYQWNFVTEPGVDFTDTGSADCH